MYVLRMIIYTGRNYILRRVAETDRLLNQAELHHDWPLHDDITHTWLAAWLSG